LGKYQKAYQKQFGTELKKIILFISYKIFLVEVIYKSFGALLWRKSCQQAMG
jgi:hypothetical protein